MAMTAAEKLRAALAASEEKKTKTPTQSGENAFYPFWNIAENATATVRFLPDADTENPFFWIIKETIRLPFAGRVGGDYPTDKQVSVTVPCVDMFGDVCPIIAETRPWWRQGKEKEDLARIYYKKKAYIFQGFVVNSPFEEQNVPENPIRRFSINNSIFDIIKTSLMNPEMEDLPIDFVGGRDFKISKTKKGEYANYGTSTWSFRTRALNEIENAAIEQYGLLNLSVLKGARPDADGIAMIKAMFHDSLEGKPFDHDSYGSIYRAYGDRDSQSNDAETPPQATQRSTSSVSRPTQNHVDNEEVVETRVNLASQNTPSNTTKSSTQASDILDRIRKKTQAAS